MDFDLYNCPGGIKDIEEFSDITVEKNALSIDQPLETQGILDSLDTMQFIFFLEKKYGKILSKEEIASLKLYRDLINKFQN